MAGSQLCGLSMGSLVDGFVSGTMRKVKKTTTGLSLCKIEMTYPQLYTGSSSEKAKLGKI